MIHRPRFKLVTLLWLTACAASLFAGAQRQKEWDAHWFAGIGDAGPDENDFRITIKPDALGRLMTTVEWGDGLTVRYERGRVPKGAPGGGPEYMIPGRAATDAERRRVEQEHGLAAGTLNRWPAAPRN